MPAREAGSQVDVSESVDLLDPDPVDETDQAEQPVSRDDLIGQEATTLCLFGTGECSRSTKWRTSRMNPRVTLRGVTEDPWRYRPSSGVLQQAVRPVRRPDLCSFAVTGSTKQLPSLRRTLQPLPCPLLVPRMLAVQRPCP